MIDTEALRKKVIDLAIQGKLTQQLPEDGNAEDLYAQIQNEKTQLLKEGKIKKEKQLPEISDNEIPFEIPSNWKWVRLRDICRKIVDGDHNPPSGVREKTNYLMLSAQNINNDRIENLESARYLSEEVFIEENKRTNLEKGDVLLTIVATLGRSCVYRENYNVCFQRSVCVISTLIMPEYLKRFFDSGYIQKLMSDGATGAAQPGFYLNKVERIIVPLPPLKEQERIVKRIEDAISLVSSIKNLQQQYEADREILKGKIIDACIRGKLTEQLKEDGNAEDLYAQIQEEKARLVKEGKISKEKHLPEISDDEIPFEIPNNWKWVHLFDCGVTQTGNTPSKTHPEYFGNDLSFIGPGDIVNGKIIYGRQGLSTIGKSFGRVCSPGSIMQVCIGGSIGKCAITDKETAFNQQINSLSPIMGDSKYLYYVLCSGYFYGIINHFAAGMATPIINKSSWDSLLVPLPPYKEQKRITESIDEVWRALELLDGGSNED